MVRSTTAGVWMLAAVFGCQPGEGSAPSADSVDASDDAKSKGQLNVEVFYRERIMLPPTAILEVVLEDGAKMDVPAVRIAKTTVPVKTGPPYRVTLDVDTATLDPRGRYGVRARIENDEVLLFTSTTFNPAFGVQGSTSEPMNDPVEVMLSQVPRGQKPVGASITSTRWVLETLRGKTAGLGAGGRPAEITLQGSEPRASGFAGCNQVSGGYTLEGNQLSFGNMAMTMRACTEGMELERDFAKVLGETKSYQIEGSSLSLRDENGTVLAVLKAG